MRCQYNRFPFIISSKFIEYKNKNNNNEQTTISIIYEIWYHHISAPAAAAVVVFVLFITDFLYILIIFLLLFDCSLHLSTNKSSITYEFVVVIIIIIIIIIDISDYCYYYCFFFIKYRKIWPTNQARNARLEFNLSLLRNFMLSLVCIIYCILALTHSKKKTYKYTELFS